MAQTVFAYLNKHMLICWINLPPPLPSTVFESRYEEVVYKSVGAVMKKHLYKGNTKQAQ